ncbi:MAG: hypothetical protein H8F28_09770 [Fibrella sp.]|nr:hypothetical protein [Armatimonadota bacterium]
MDTPDEKRGNTPEERLTGGATNVAPPVGFRAAGLLCYTVLGSEADLETG